MADRDLDRALRDLEREWHRRGGCYALCGASSGSCFHPACRCPCHSWAREVLYALDLRQREAARRSATLMIHITGPLMGGQPMVRAERDLQDAARLAAAREQLAR